MFCISIRNDINCGFSFPNKINKELNFRDYLLDFVENQYYLNEDDLLKVKGFGANYSFGGYLSNSNIYNTITKSYGKVTGNSMKFYRDGKISYLHPNETFRLMGFSDEDYQKCNRKINEFTVSDSRKTKEEYARAGNSIVVNVVLEIFKELKRQYPRDFKDLDLVSLFSGIGAFEKALDLLK